MNQISEIVGNMTISIRHAQSLCLNANAGYGTTSAFLCEERAGGPMAGNAHL